MGTQSIRVGSSPLREANVGLRPAVLGSVGGKTGKSQGNAEKGNSVQSVLRFASRNITPGQEHPPLSITGKFNSNQPVCSNPGTFNHLFEPSSLYGTCRRRNEKEYVLVCTDKTRYPLGFQVTTVTCGSRDTQEMPAT